jgi:signal transduction histidine kinase
MALPSAPTSGQSNNDSPGKVGAWSSIASESGSTALSVTNHRILIVDDNSAIHEDFRKVLAGNLGPELELLRAEQALFGDELVPKLNPDFELDSAFQGQEALGKVQQSVQNGRPYAVAFVDVRMPPGWDGIETVKRFWEVDRDLQVIICTAYSDYSWDEMLRTLGASDNLVILKKPFDNVEVLQLAFAFTRKWELKRQANLKLDELTSMVAERTGELERANEELRRQMQERIQAERQLRQAQKMEAVGQLAAGVAHDFNNILTVIHGHASMLLMRTGERGPQAKSAVQIAASADRAANLVRQLLAFSRKQLLQFRNVELPEVIRSIGGMLRQLVGERITLDTELECKVPPVFADRGMIEQAIVNLTLNARDALLPRGGRIQLTSSSITLNEQESTRHPDARPGCFTCLTVTDNGSGMSAETMSHLFEPFFTTKEVGKGTGLGLATVYGIIKQHQGWIEVKSQVGEGTTFQIFFPASTHSSPRPAESKSASSKRAGTETILIAEDEAPVREMIGEVLTLQGYRVLLADSGPAALEVCRKEKGRIDLLLTDMVMPGGMMGTEVATELRRNNPALKVIYTTGYSPGTAGVQDSFREGTNLLPKPYAPNTLVELIRKCLDS